MMRGGGGHTYFGRVFAGGLINAIFAKNFDQVNSIPTFVLTPLTYFGGVFYRVRPAARVGAEDLDGQSDPAHGERLSLRLPRHSDVSVPGAFAIMIVCVVAMFTASVMLLNRGSGTRD